MASFFSKLFSGSSGSLLGLSIGTSSIKLVELKKIGKVFKILHFGIVQLPEDAIINREIANPVAVIDALKTLLDQMKLKNKTVCIGLSGTAVMVKRMTIEVLKIEDLRDQVFWEAEQYLPFDVAEVQMDFQVLKKDSANKIDVILAAIKKSVMESYISCIEEAGLKCKTVDVDFFALENLFEANYVGQSQAAVALIDIGASSLKVIVSQDGLPLFIKDTAIGGKNLTSEIQKVLNLSFLDAEALKCAGSVQGGTPSEIQELSAMISENFATEVKRSIDFYHASGSGAPIGSIFLTGGSSRLDQLVQTIEEATRITTQILNPFYSISYDPAIFKQEYMDSIASVASIPIGLAIRAGL